MITTSRDGGAKTYFGLSTDTKPTDKTVANGSCFLEMNTSKIYFYNGASKTWIEWGASS